MKFRIACIIPARLASSRLPEKILVPLAGVPLLERTWQAANKVSLFDEVVCAIDAQPTAQLVEQFGGKYIMTSESCLNGTERLVELAHRKAIQADIWVNWQADSPFLTEDMINHLLQSCGHDEADVWTLKKRISNMAEIIQPSTAKVVCDAKGYALYFSRSPIPYYQNGGNSIETQTYYKHIGIYAYTTKALQTIAQLQAAPLETAESLEQLRFLTNGLKIKVHETFSDHIEINVPQDVIQAEKYLHNTIQI